MTSSKTWWRIWSSTDLRTLLTSSLRSWLHQKLNVWLLWDPREASARRSHWALVNTYLRRRWVQLVARVALNNHSCVSQWVICCAKRFRRSQSLASLSLNQGRITVMSRMRSWLNWWRCKLSSWKRKATAPQVGLSRASPALAYRQSLSRRWALSQISSYFSTSQRTSQSIKLRETSRVTTRSFNSKRKTSISSLLMLSLNIDFK